MNEVETQDNKGLLWNLLSEGSIFDNIPESRIDLIKLHFESKIKEVKKKSNSYDTLTDLNKKIIKDLMQELNVYRIKKKEMIENKIVDNNLERKNTFEETLRAHQNDMSRQLNKNPPNEIDFSDNIEEIPIMNKDLEAVIKERDNQLRSYVPNEKKSNNITIGEDINLENNIIEPIEKSKKVTFEINEIPTLSEPEPSSEQEQRPAPAPVPEPEPAPSPEQEQTFIEANDTNNTNDMMSSFMSKLKTDNKEMINTQIDKIMNELNILKTMLNNDAK